MVIIIPKDKLKIIKIIKIYLKYLLKPIDRMIYKEYYNKVIIFIHPQLLLIIKYNLKRKELIMSNKEIKIGDIVGVINKGKEYTMYSGWSGFNKIDPFYRDYYKELMCKNYGYEYYNYDYEYNYEYIVIQIEKHNIYNCNLCLIQDLNNNKIVLLFGVEGLEFIRHEPNSNLIPKVFKSEKPKKSDSNSELSGNVIIISEKPNGRVTAVHTRDGKYVKSSNSKVGREDVYSFNCGAEVAFNRLLGAELVEKLLPLSEIPTYELLKELNQRFRDLGDKNYKVKVIKGNKDKKEVKWYGFSDNDEDDEWVL